MKKRITLFSFYEPEGIIDDYVIDLLKQINEISSMVIFVVNGKVNRTELLDDLVNKVIVRDNNGYDAGAYAEIINTQLAEETLRQYDELILCNNTFIGPFKRLSEIFNEMEKIRPHDFWGFNCMESMFSRYLQSCFLVFKERILQDGVVYEYFTNYIYERIHCIEDAYFRFENGLFQYLLMKGYRWDSYCYITHVNPYRSGDACIEYGMPILKTKYIKECDDNRKIKRTLMLIHDRYGNDLSIVKKYVNRVSRSYIDSSERILDPQCEEIVLYKNYFGLEFRILRYFIQYNHIYIYGTGRYARALYQTFFSYREGAVKGFLLTSKDEDARTEDDISILEYNEEYDNEPVIVAMSYKNTLGLIEQIGKKPKWFYILGTV